MHEAYAGKLAALADGERAARRSPRPCAVRGIERPHGAHRVFASLLYAADTSDPARQEILATFRKITTISPSFCSSRSSSIGSTTSCSICHGRPGARALPALA